MAETQQTPPRRRRRATPQDDSHLNGPERARREVSLRTRATHREDAVVGEIKRGLESQQISDPLAKEGGMAARLISPRYNPKAIDELVARNSTLRQCIDAMTVNVTGYGYEVAYTGPEGEQEQHEQEAGIYQEGLDAPNDQYGLLELASAVYRDRKQFGGGMRHRF